jgi:hypothetical protein
MLLVPKQLLRSGMTGNVPYYGGRFTPAQTWGISHPTEAPLTAPSTRPAVRARPPAAARVPAAAGPATRAALDHLRESGVLTATEYDELLRRIGR